MAKVEDLLLSLCHVDFPQLQGLLEHIFQNRGKQLRPALTLLAGHFYRYNLDLLLPMAAAVELLHTATLVHDDTIDNALVRRGHPTVNSLWNGTTAVLLGDYLFATSANLVSTTGNVRVMRLFAQTLTTICSGELRQVFSSFQWSQSREEYYRRIERKTASLFSMATESGAVLSQASEEAVQALKGYGHQLGIAFQIVDDILDFTGDEEELGKPVGSDLLQGTITLPTLLLLERYPERNPVQRALQEEGREAYLQEAIEMIRNSSIISECYELAVGFGERAKVALGALPDGASKRALFHIAEYVLERKR